ncbi:hypothetical protein BDV18DRAFT_138147 [Aspergillus unguis]
MGVGGIILRFFNLAIRVLQFLDSAVILGIYSYFLAKLAQHDMHIPTWMKAVEGLSGAATLYGLLGCLFTCFLGGFTFFAALAMILDVCFVGAMIAIAVMTRDGTNHCSGTMSTPLGTGVDNTDSPSGVDYGYACMLEKVVFAVSIIGIFFFLISILFQFLLARHHRREKRFGPSPANNYTYGKSRGFWRRNKGSPEQVNGDNMLPSHPTPHDVETGPAGGAAPQTSGAIPATNEKQSWFNKFGRKQDPVDATAQPAYATPQPAPAAGYGNSAYTGNY